MNLTLDVMMVERLKKDCMNAWEDWCHILQKKKEKLICKLLNFILLEVFLKWKMQRNAEKH